MGLSDSERISMIRSAVLIQYTRVTDRQTDRQTELAWHIRAIAYMLSRVKMIQEPRQNLDRVQQLTDFSPADRYSFLKIVSQSVDNFFNEILQTQRQTHKTLQKHNVLSSGNNQCTWSHLLCQAAEGTLHSGLLACFLFSKCQQSSDM